MVYSDDDPPTEGQIAVFKEAHMHVSTARPAQASQFPDLGKGATKASGSKFKMILARLSDEFDQVSTMLDKESKRCVDLEAQVSFLSAEVDKQSAMDAFVRNGDDTQDSTPECNHVVPQPPKERCFSKSDHDDLKDEHKSKEEQLEDLQPANKIEKGGTLGDFEILKGWRSIGSMYGSSFRSQVTSQRTLTKKAGCIQSHTQQIVQSQAFDLICSIVIIYNATLLGAAADYAAVNHSDPQKPPPFYQVSDRVCTVWFVLELMMRIPAAGVQQFFMGSLWTWNMLDFIVVVGDLLITILDIIAKHVLLDLTFLRMLRVLRVTRAIRVVRLVRFFKELRMMVVSVLSSGASLLWSLTLLGLIHYIFGLFLMQQVNEYLWEEYAGDLASVSAEDAVEISNLQKNWGSLLSSIYTMYACMSGGADWQEIANRLLEISWVNGVTMAFFIFFCTVVVMNIITGIFVDTAIQSAQSDRDEIIQEQIHNQESELAKLKQTFLEADTDDSGTVTMPEFEHHLQDPHVRAHLSSIGLEIHEALGLFRLLDIDASGEVGIEQFVIGCMRLKGNAKSIDLATLMYENKRMVQQHSYFHEICKRKFSEILGATESLRLEINSPLVVRQEDKSCQSCLV